MKKKLIWVLALTSNGLALAQDVGQVISSTPIIQQVAIPRQVCNTEQVAVQQPRSGAGAVLGALAGGAAGNAIGNGGGRAAATLLGIFGGTIVGDRIEGGSPVQLNNVQRCSNQTFYENRPVAYNVVYEFAGRQYAVQMPNDPGPTIALQISPADTQMVPPAANNAYTQPFYGPPAAVFVAPPSYHRYYVQPTYPTFGIELDYGYRNGYRERRHWR
ncbi:MAG: hypothetical protein ACI9I0_000363 [Rhodoferax sp.]|jgi:uncharacterized protein YcfJ